MQTISKFERKIGWIGFFLIIVIEYLLFHYYAAHNIIPFYPANFDQTDYLKDSHLLLQFFQGKLSFATVTWISNGVLFQLLAASTFFLFGPTRLVALSINFVFFCIMQWTLVLAALKRYRAWAFTFLLWGMVVTPSFLYAGAGGLFDFRMDFATLCLYGTLVNLFVLSERFTIPRINLLCVFCLIFLLGIRFITITYLIAFFSIYLFLTYFFVVIRDNTSRKNLFILLGVSLSFGIIYFMCFFKALYGYYFVGHVLSNEKNVRILEQGIHNVADSLFFYPISFWKNNLTPSLHYYLFFLLFCGAFYVWYPRENKPSYLRCLKADHYLFGLLLFILIPYAILTTDSVKSPLVFSLVLVPFLWIVCELLFVACSGQPLNKITRILFYLISLSCFLGVEHRLFHKLHEEDVKNLTVISNIYEEIGNRAIAKHRSSIHVSFNKIVDYLASHGISVFYYERHQQWINVEVTRLGGQIFPISKEEAIDALQMSDFVVFEENCQTEGFSYPLTQSVTKIRPSLTPTLKKYFILIHTYNVNHCELNLYERK